MIMVESNRRPSLLEQVAQQKKAQEAQRLSETQANQMLPDFKAQLGNLIAAKVPPPVTQEVTVFNLFGGGEVDEYAFDSYERRKLRTKLTAIIPLEDGATALLPYLHQVIQTQMIPIPQKR
jgi:hypothetical protein